MDTHVLIESLKWASGALGVILVLYVIVAGRPTRFLPLAASRALMCTFLVVCAIQSNWLIWPTALAVFFFALTLLALAQWRAAKRAQGS